MTSRERFLLVLLGLSGVGASALWAGQSYLDELLRLDARFGSLQKEVVQMQTRLLEGATGGADPGLSQLAIRFWPLGTLPDPLVLARKIKPVLDQSGVFSNEFQVILSTPQEFRLRYTLDAPMASFLRAFTSLRSSDPRLIVWQFSATERERGLYAIEWEVGYAVQP